ncbi:class I SAM-dependent methyltransferase [Mucilaginibacter angelicae]|uniref:Class I SAM-dependent methyltransferase n=1 Tax=Mucilaginibacter angelicae TaxID=869718 RepID=A0ABV6L524_9SPHI
MNELISTPERLDTTQHDQIMAEHLHRYALAAGYVKDKTVLDIASGEGYGTHLLSAGAKMVYGVDVSELAVSHAARKYQKGNLLFKQGSAASIPLEDHCVDIITSFETIEHHDLHDEMITECRRVLKPGGLLIISSPEKKYYSDLANYRNPYHVKELYGHEFRALLLKYFGNVSFLNQKYVTASVIIPEQGTADIRQYHGTYEKLLSEDTFTPLYHIALASDAALPAISSSFYMHDIPPDNKEARLAALYTGSTTWKIGRAVLGPFLLIKSLFKR